MENKLENASTWKTGFESPKHVLYKSREHKLNQSLGFSICSKIAVRRSIARGHHLITPTLGFKFLDLCSAFKLKLCMHTESRENSKHQIC